ncbi:maleylacetoacetate isomerase [Trichonephila clavata]|uniref:maleylacetoacetate isomerase n=1 Tax=Trichonephila clavata TaxID=2740835 RepID=A0A8X6GUM5_TRICU|nr:maleylacetoacetate isomerase [Trichonephila clavata]
MAQSKPILYSYFRSSCSWRVRIALAYKEIDYEYKAVNLLKGEQLSDAFKKVNPCASVPVLVDKGNAISSSNAILEYLEETVPSPALLPADPFAKAKVREIVDSIVASIQPLQNMKVLQYVNKELGKDSKAWGKCWVESGFKSLERILEETHGTFCVGEEITLADVCLVPQVFNASRFDVDMAPFPLISKISSRLNGLRAFKDSHPFVQPDCPDDLKASK